MLKDDYIDNLCMYLNTSCIC